MLAWGVRPILELVGSSSVLANTLYFAGAMQHWAPIGGECGKGGFFSVGRRFLPDGPCAGPAEAGCQDATIEP